MTDDELMQSSRDGSREAFGQLFDRHRAAIWGFFRRRVSDPSRAEDLSQETFVALLQNVPRYEARDAFRGYLFGIAYHVLSAERRRSAAARENDRRRSAAERGDAAEMDLLQAHTANLDVVMLVRQAIAELDPIDREVLMLREFESLSYAEMAAVLEIPVNTVRSRLFRARMALKEKLQ